MSDNNINVNQQREQRLEMWRLALQSEMQEIMKESSIIREKIEGAKTNYKKQFYKKKQKKLQEHAFKVLTALQRLPQPQQENEIGKPITKEQPTN